MPRPHHKHRYRGSAVVALALIAATVGGCVTPRAELSTPPSTHPHARTVALQPDPAIDGVCDEFVRVALSSDTAIDTSPADARRRAAQRHGTPELAERLDHHGVGADHTWQRLTAQRARIEVTTTLVGDDPPPSTSTVAGAAVLATRTAIGVSSDGSPWRDRLPDVVAHCTLTQHDSSWLVADLTVDTSSATTTTEPGSGGGR